jgi:broad specificity phosphatase PhoE
MEAFRRRFCTLARDRRPVCTKRIILIRHGESLGNLSDLTYVTTPDWKIPLSTRGIEQAVAAGKELRTLIGDGSLYIYVSPYLRTRQTVEHVVKQFHESQVVTVREEPRISEQQFGNFQVRELRNNV